MIKDEACVVNRDEYANIGTHWFVIYAKMVKEYISIAWFLVLAQIKKIIVNEIINANIYRIQAYDSLMCNTFV